MAAAKAVRNSDTDGTRRSGEDDTVRPSHGNLADCAPLRRWLPCHDDGRGRDQRDVDININNNDEEDEDEGEGWRRRMDNMTARRRRGVVLPTSGWAVRRTALSGRHHASPSRQQRLPLPLVPEDQLVSSATASCPLTGPHRAPPPATTTTTRTTASGPKSNRGAGRR